MGAAIRLEPWGPADAGLLHGLVGDPAMMEHLGGAESDQKIRARQRRYEAADSGMFRIVDAASGEGVGSVGFWEREWRGERVYETGWSVLPAHQGRGFAAAAAAAIVDRAAGAGGCDSLHAFPAPGNEPSNAICRRLGFELLGETDIEYPPGNLTRCNDWRLRLG